MRVAANAATTASRYAKNRAAFLALRDEIKQTLDDGWSVKEIWKTLHQEGKVTFGYHAFCRYVKRLAGAPRSKRGWDHVAIKKEQQKTFEKPHPVRDRQVNNSGTTTGIRDFTFDPVPHEEEII